MNLVQKARFFIFSMCCIGIAGVQAEEIKLPQPNLDKPFMQLLKKRHSTRSYSTKEISDQALSELLWAAFGINRPDTGGRTAPSARNVREISIYVIMATGSYLYVAENNSLKLVNEKNLLPLVTPQEFVKTAPIHLVFVSDLSKMDKTSGKAELWAMSHTGFISENVYLYCAAEGIGTVVRASMDVAGLRKELGLSDQQMITLTQTIGYPGE